MVTVVAQLPDAAGVSGAEALTPGHLTNVAKTAVSTARTAVPRVKAPATVKAAAPAKAVAPVKATVAPVKAAVAPVKATVAPVKAAVAPVKATVAPVKAAATSLVPVSTPVQPPPAPIAPPPAIKAPSAPPPAPRVPSAPVTPPPAPVTPPKVTVKTPRPPAPAKVPAAPAVKVPVPPAVQGVAGAAAEPVSTLPGPAPVAVRAKVRTVTRTLARQSGLGLARSGSGDPAAAPQAGAVVPALAALSGLSSEAGASTGTHPPALSARQVATLLAHGRALLDHPRMRAFVLEIAGCLDALPARLRTVVRLRTGLHERRRLSAPAVARRLHISRKRLATMEIRAVRLLWRAARTTGCARRAARVAGLEPVAFFGGPGAPTGGGAAGGVAGALYLKAPSKADASPVPPGSSVPSPRLQVPAGSDSPLIWVLVALLAGSALVVYLVRQDMGLGALSARHRRKRGPGRGAGPGKRSDED